MRSLKLTSLVVMGAIVLSTLGIKAADMLNGSANLAHVFEAGRGCPKGTVTTAVRDRTLCVDQYEASPSSECPHLDPVTVRASEENLSTEGCLAVSKPDLLPWRSINQAQAARACAASGKRLMNNAEWYRAALGSPNNTQCVTNENAPRVSGASACVSGVGAHDMVGNVWEWTDEMVEEGVYAGRVLPDTGYVAAVDVDGVALNSSDSGDVLYGDDYVWNDRRVVAGMMRGGFYGSGEDAGLYTLNAAVPLDFSSAGIGFRCAQNLI